MLEQQVRRMLADPRATALVDNFAGQWLVLRNIRDVSPDADLFPDFDENLRDAFLQETALFFESQLKEDRSVVELLSADYTFVNERLARHYGIPNVYGDRFRRVSLTDGRRGGLLGQGSLLTVTSYPNRTSPVLRGKWLLETILGTPPPPPPPDVPALQERGEGGKIASVRERLEAHRNNPACSGCHSIDGSARVRARELRPDRPLAHRGRRHAGRRLRRAAERRDFEGVTGLRALLLAAAGPVRHQRHRKADGVCARPRRRVLRPAVGAAHCARRGGAGLPLVVDHSRHRQERTVPDAEVGVDDCHEESHPAADGAARTWARRWRCRCSTAWCRRCRRCRRRPRARCAVLAWSTRPTA